MVSRKGKSEARLRRRQSERRSKRLEDNREPLPEGLRRAITGLLPSRRTPPWTRRLSSRRGRGLDVLHTLNRTADFSPRWSIRRHSNSRDFATGHGDPVHLERAFRLYCFHTRCVAFWGLRGTSCLFPVRTPYRAGGAFAPPPPLHSFLSHTWGGISSGFSTVEPLRQIVYAGPGSSPAAREASSSNMRE